MSGLQGCFYVSVCFLKYVIFDNFEFYYPNMNCWFSYFTKVIFEVLMMVIMNIHVFWDELLYNFLCCYQRLQNSLCKGNALDLLVEGVWFRSVSRYRMS
jgi:hypothetical protein